MEENIKQDIEIIVFDCDIKLLIDGIPITYSRYKNLNIKLIYFRNLELYIKHCKRKNNRSLKDYEG